MFILLTVVFLFVLLDDYDILERKIQLFIDGEVKRKPPEKKGKKGKGKDKDSNPSSEKSSADDKKSEKSSKAKGGKGKGKNKFITLDIIPKNLIVDMLYRQLKKYKTGLVIDSLNSIFLDLPIDVFEILLHGMERIRHVHFAILKYSWENFIDDKVAEMPKPPEPELPKGE